MGWAVTSHPGSELHVLQKVGHKCALGKLLQTCAYYAKLHTQMRVLGIFMRTFLY